MFTASTTANPDPLDRSPSLTSNSSAASSVPPATPAMSSNAPSWSSNSSSKSSNNLSATNKVLSYQAKLLNRTTSVTSSSGGISSLARPTSPEQTSARIPWQPGHRQTSSLDARLASSTSIANMNGNNITHSYPLKRSETPSREHQRPATSNGIIRTQSVYPTEPFKPSTNTSNIPRSETKSKFLASAIMSHSSFAGSYRENRNSVDLGAMNELSKSSVDSVRKMREFVVTASPESRSPTLANDATRFLVRGNTHKRAQTMPHIDATLARSNTSSSAGSIYSRGTASPGLHGLDRLSERDDEVHPSGAFLKPQSSVSRRMASDAGEDEQGQLVIPGLGDEVAGMPSRLKLSRQPTTSTGGTAFSQTVKQMDSQRHCLQAYEYLCHVEEAKKWMESCLASHPLASPDPSLPTVDSPHHTGILGLEESLRNGIDLARLARALDPDGHKTVPRIFAHPKLQYRHIDNINYFFDFCRNVGLPRVFCFETTDLYNAKNLPKVIYCIHALSHLMARHGLTDRISNLVGHIEFTDEELRTKQQGLDASGVAMPSFGNIGRAMAKEFNEVIEEPEPEPEPPVPQETEAQRQQRLLAEATPGITALTARVRGNAARQRHQLKLAASSVITLQSRIRGNITRRHFADKIDEKRWATSVQAQVRGVMIRKRFYGNLHQLSTHDEVMSRFQAVARGVLARRQKQQQSVDIQDSARTITAVQAVIRRNLARSRLRNQVTSLRQAEPAVVGLQSAIRARLVKQKQERQEYQFAHPHVARSVVNIQSAARAALTRRKVEAQVKELHDTSLAVVKLQAAVRGVLAKKAYHSWRSYLLNHQTEATFLQSLLLGHLSRKRYYGKLNHYYQHMEKVVKIQSLFRRRQPEAQYRQLKKGTNVPISTIKNFVHLLSDNDRDYREDLEVETLKKEVVTRIRQNQTLEADVNELDIRIALIIKNKLSLDEVLRARRHGLGVTRRNSVLMAAGDPFAAANLDQNNMRKLELYQQIFYLLQTKPEYLARLFLVLSRMEMVEKQRKALEGAVLTLFGYAAKFREEFLLLRLLQRSIHEEVNAIDSLQAFVQSDFIFIKIVQQYGRGAKEKDFLTSCLGPNVKQTVDDMNLDFETDPARVYRALIAEEETRTGLQSRRPLHLDALQALQNDVDTRTKFTRNLQGLRATTAAFLQSLFASTAKMPFGLRYITREIFFALQSRFPNEPQDSLLRVVGHFIYYRYINPFIVAPESFDAVQGVVGPVQRRNLAEVAKILNMVAAGRYFTDTEPCLRPLNDHIMHSISQYMNWILALIAVEDAESYYQADEYLDHSLAHKPIIYISPNEIYAMHSLVVQHMDSIAPQHDDPLRNLVTELGGAPLGASAELDEARKAEISLNLKSTLQEADPHSTEKSEFTQAKRCVLYLLRVQPAENLFDALIQDVTQDHEDAWDRIRFEEMAASRSMHRRSQATISSSTHTASDDVRQLSFRGLKAKTLQHIRWLEQHGHVNRISRSDGYQHILDSIAQDIRNRNRKRVVRQREIMTMSSTLQTLDQKKRYLDEQIETFKSFNDQAKTAVQKNRKRRLVLPFTSQYYHQRDLKKAGKEAKLGSYKYPARTLLDRKILIATDPKIPLDTLFFTMSSDEAGVFTIDASVNGEVVPDGETELFMDELLKSQFEGQQTVELGTIAKANLNQLLFQLNKKFYA